MSAYFVPTRTGVDALVALAGQGTRVRILTNSLEATDVTVVHAGYAGRRRPLLQAGIELFELQRLSAQRRRRRGKGRFGRSATSLHAKTIAPYIEGRGGVYDVFGRHGRFLTPRRTYDDVRHRPAQPGDLRQHVITVLRLFPNAVVIWNRDHAELWTALPDGNDPDHCIVRLWLITPQRRGLARIYSRRDRARLAWILRGKRVGFSLAEIREMIDLYDAGEDQDAQRRAAIARCTDRIDQLRRQRDDIDAAIAELTDFIALARDGS